MILAILILWVLDLIIPALMVPGYVYGILLISTLVVLLIGFAGSDL